MRLVDVGAAREISCRQNHAGDVTARGRKDLSRVRVLLQVGSYVIGLGACSIVWGFGARGN